MKKLFLMLFLLTLLSIEIYGQCAEGQFYDPVSGYCFDDADSYTEFLGHGIRLRKWAIGDNPGTGYNSNIDDIADIFLHREFEYQVNQIRVTNGAIIVASGSKLDIGSDSISTSWATAKLVFEDVTGRGLVPFEIGDILFSRTIAKSGAGYDADGNIIDSDALIRQFVYEVDSVSGLNVWVSPHVDAKVPDNKGAPEAGDTFVKIGNVTSGANVIEISSDLKYAPRMTMIVDVKSWSDFLDEDHKSVVIGNMNGLTDVDGAPIVTDKYGIMINGGVTGGLAVLKNVDITMNNQSSISISGFNNDAGFTDDTQANAALSAANDAQADATQALADASTAYSLAGDAYTFAGTKNKSSYGSSAPSSPTIGDFWIDTSGGAGNYLQKRWNGSSWIPVGVYMDNSGVYTSTLTAGQVNAVDLYAHKIVAGNGIVNSLSILSTLTMGSASTNGYIQSYGWNGTANGYQLKGGASPSFSVIGGVITGGTVQTDDAGERIVINSSSHAIEFYGASGFEGSIYGNLTGQGIGIAGKFHVGGVLTANSEILGTYYIEATSGFRQGTMTAGRYLRSNGTNFVSAVPLSTDIDATVSSTEFGYINSLTSNAQTQLNTKLVYWSAVYTGAPGAGVGKNGDIAYDEDLGGRYVKINGSWEVL